VRKAALIYNPASGAGRARRAANVEAAAQVFGASGIAVEMVATTGPGSAIVQARELAGAGFDAIIACGGDGTVNEVAQGILESGADTALGVIPLGTANALAAEMGLPANAADAARVLIEGERRRIAVGKMTFRNGKGAPAERYWLMAASVGVDAELMYVISTMHKGRYGMVAYWAGGLRLLITHRFIPFEVEFIEVETGLERREVVAYFLLARVANFGKMFRRVAPNAALTRDDATLILFKTRRRLAYLSFALRVLVGGDWKVANVESVQIKELNAQAIGLPESLRVAGRGTGSVQRQLRAEVDGEVVGTLPARSTIVPDALTMLFPRTAR
jgi:YegS/Rv2252/BmrU family lipid kinase